MIESLSVTIKFYGGLRDAGSEVLLTMEKGASIPEIKEALSHHLKGKFSDLIAVSALTDNQKILSDDYVATSSCDLGILPPVCGG